MIYYFNSYRRLLQICDI